MYIRWKRHAFLKTCIWCRPKDESHSICCRLFMSSWICFSFNILSVLPTAAINFLHWIFLSIQLKLLQHSWRQVDMATLSQPDQVNEDITELLSQVLLVFLRPSYTRLDVANHDYVCRWIERTLAWIIAGQLVFSYLVGLPWLLLSIDCNGHIRVTLDNCLPIWMCGVNNGPFEW